MKANLFRKFIVSLSVIVILVLLFMWTDNITDRNSGSAYQTEKIIRSIILLTAAWFTMRFVTITFLNPINARRKKNLPNIVKDIIGGLVYFIAISVIITEVYDKTMASIAAFFISSWAIIGFAAKDLIANCIHGISLDLQADFELEDWVQFKDGTIGKITKMKMTGVNVLLPNSSILFISNAMLNSDPMVNLSKPDRDYYVNVSVVLEHKVPVARGRRMLLDAVTRAPGVYNHCAKVFSESIRKTGVAYTIYFKVSDRSVWLETRHQVIQGVTEHLHKFNLKIRQITGEINFNSTPNNADIMFNEGYVVSAIEALKISKLLDNCDSETRKEFSKHMKLRKFNSGQSIIKQGEEGNSMFIIADGVVDTEVGSNEEVAGKYRDTCLVGGDYFGEPALLLGEKRSATLIARTDVVLYEIDRGAVNKAAERDLDFICKISESLVKHKSKNIGATGELIEQEEGNTKAVSEPADALKNT